MADLLSTFYKLLIEPLAVELQRAAQGVVDEASVRRGRDWVEAAQREFPLASVFIDSLINSEPENVTHDLIKMARYYQIDLRALKGNQHVLNYIREVQKRVRSSEFRVPSPDLRMIEPTHFSSIPERYQFAISAAVKYFRDNPNATLFHVPELTKCHIDRRPGLKHDSSVALVIDDGRIVARVEFQD